MRCQGLSAQAMAPSSSFKTAGTAGSGESHYCSTCIAFLGRAWPSINMARDVRHNPSRVESVSLKVFYRRLKPSLARSSRYKMHFPVSVPPYEHSWYLGMHCEGRKGCTRPAKTHPSGEEDPRMSRSKAKSMDENTALQRCLSQGCAGSYICLCDIQPRGLGDSVNASCFPTDQT